MFIGYLCIFCELLTRIFCPAHKDKTFVFLLALQDFFLPCLWFSVTPLRRRRR